VKHYGIGAWVDHVRGLGDATTRQRMARHLAACPRCARLAAWLSELGAVVRMDAEVEVPDGVVRAAIALFTELHGRQRSDERQ